jgi:hypothetical protein
VAVPSQDVRVDTTIDQPTADRVVLAERADAGWRATLDGKALEPLDADGLLAFALPGGRGELVVSYSDPLRPWLLAAQGTALLVVVLLMLPSLRQREDELDDDLDLDADRVRVSA